MARVQEYKPANRERTNPPKTRAQYLVNVKKGEGKRGKENIGKIKFRGVPQNLSCESGSEGSLFNEPQRKPKLYPTMNEGGGRGGGGPKNRGE